MSLLSDIWSILTRPQKRHVLAVQLLSLVMAFSTVTGIAAITPFFAVLGEPQWVDHNGLLHWLYVQGGFAGPRQFVVALGIGFIAVVLISNLINVLGALVVNRLALLIGTELQTALFAQYLSRPYSFHTVTNSATLFNSVVHETARVTNGILQNVFVLVTNLFTASFIILSILVVNPAVAVAMIACLAGGYTLIYLTVRNRLLRFGQVQSQFSIEQAKRVQESFGAIREIILLQVQGFFRDAVERASRAVSLAAAHCHLVAQIPKHIMECVAVAGLVVLALVLGGREGGVGPWLGQLTFLAFAAYRLLPTLQQIFAAIVRIRADRAGLAVIAPDLRLARQAAARADCSRTDPEWHDQPRREIRIRDVSFRYAPDRPWALNGVSLSIAARTAVGIVGANGSGKTTLVDLIAGLLEPETGQVEVDGVALDAARRAAWQARLAYVPQHIFLMDASIAQNIALGVPPAEIDRVRLRAAVELAQLDSLIRTLPRGYDHVVGERGVGLSGGQRQRIGIARALYKVSSVLILDEATNALDGLTEQELLATLEKLRGRYTTVLIAHRLSTVRSCDVIFELAGGRVTGCGTYDQLLERSETFRQMALVR